MAFQSTPPARGATCSGDSDRRQSCISIHAPREGGDGDVVPQLLPPHPISIHAPREGGDAWRSSRGGGHYISIHAPREGGDARTHGKPQALVNISIHAPREGGDYQWALDAATLKVISIHAPREGGDGYDQAVEMTTDISIHAPREGGDHTLRRTL